MNIRNTEIAKNIGSQADLQHRLKRSEENLRYETAQNEEQRAQLNILKQGIE